MTDLDVLTYYTIITSYISLVVLKEERERLHLVRVLV